MPKIAGDNLGIDPKSTSYGLLYAASARRGDRRAVDRHRVRRRVEAPPHPRRARRVRRASSPLRAAARRRRRRTRRSSLLGLVYFAVITSLSTVLQQDLDDAVRGKVMALWIMGFGGTVPFGGLAGGLAHRAARRSRRCWSAAPRSRSCSPGTRPSGSRRRPRTVGHGRGSRPTDRAPTRVDRRRRSAGSIGERRP